MSTVSSTLFSTSDPTTQKPGASILRQGGAAAAPGFAQVLQAFDQEEPSSLVDKVQDRNEPTTSDEADGASGDSEQEETTGAPSSDEESGSQGEPNADAHPTTTNSDDAQASDQPDDATSQDGNTQQGENVAHGAAKSEGQAKNASIQSEAGLDPLQNKSDQAKLSIRGYVKAIRADASPDLTTVAVQTRLGESQDGTGVQNQGQRPQRSPDQVQPSVTNREHAQADSARNPGDALSDTPPEAGKQGGESKRTPSVPGAHLQPAKDVTTEQARVDVQQSRSARAELASITQPVRQGTEQHRGDVQTVMARNNLNARVEGAMTSRAISGVEAGGNQSGIESASSQRNQAPRPMGDGQQAMQSKVLAQVQRGLASLMRSASGEMTLRLTPERLGELKIEIKRTGDQLSVRLTTQNSEASELLRSGSAELSRLLRAKGVDIERVHIELQQSPDDGQVAASDFDHQSDAHDEDTTPGPHSPASTGHGEDEITGTIDEPADTIWTELGLDATA
ncbi:MAG: flagellar hook-length control protein FliK [Phycisphaerales bacterium]